MRLAINGVEKPAPDAGAVERALAPFRQDDDLEICLYDPDGAALSALLNARCGWLMFLRFPGDIGFRSHNDACDHDESVTEDFRLANGQVDSYPRSWTLERATIFEAIVDFAGSAARPSSVHWHEDGAP